MTGLIPADAQTPRIADQSFQHTHRESGSEERGGGVFDLVRFVENDRVIVWKNRGVPGISQCEVGEKQVVIDDHELGVFGAPSRRRDEAVVVVLTAGTDAGIGAAHDTQPDGVFLRDRRQPRPVSRAGAFDPGPQRRQRVTKPRLAGIRTLKELVVSPKAEIVRKPLHAGCVDRGPEVVFQGWEVSLHDLVLERSGAGRDQYLAPTEGSRDQVGPGLAGSCAGFDQKGPVVDERFLDRLRHADLTRPMLVARNAVGEWAMRSEQIPRIHGSAVARALRRRGQGAIRTKQVIPIRDHNRTRRTPIVTWGLIVANVVIFLWSMALGAPEAEAVVMRFGLIPDILVHGDWGQTRSDGGALGSLVTPFTSMFLHGGLVHLGFNMLFLHIFGDNVEDVLGRRRFVVYYVLCGLGAAAGQVLVDTNSMVPMIGASGAISGVLAGYMILFPHARIVTVVPIVIFIHFMEVPAGIFIIVWFVLQLVLGYLSLGLLAEGGSSVAWFAHIGGFLAGLVSVRAFYERPRARRRRSFP